MDKKILFVCPIWGMSASFIKKDQYLLSKHFAVTPLHYDEKDKFFLLRLMKHLWNKEICFVWFSGKHAFWAWLVCRLFRKKIVIVAGGYDAIYMPEIEYGLRVEGKGWRRAYFVFRYADCVLAVSDWLKNSLKQECNAERNVQILYHGFDGSFQSQPEKENIVLMVCHINWKNVKRKGLLTFLKAAEKLPDITFNLAGGGNDGTLEYLKSIASPNVQILGNLPNSEVVEIMKRTKVYVQISYVESFGCALAEAMLCECIPVVTRRGALPEVAGENAFYVEYGDVEETAKTIREALKVSGERFRKRIINLFPIHKREQSLQEICQF